MLTKTKGLVVSKPGDLPKYVNFGLGGRAGVGKTHLLGTAGKKAKILILDTEGGNVTYSSKSFKADPAASEIDVITFDETDLTKFIHSIESVFDHLIRTKNSEGYTLVALDSLTEFQERFLSMHVAGDKRQSYGALRDTVYGIVRKATQTPVHTVFTGRLKAAHDDVLNREVVRFEVSPGVWAVISGLFDSLGYMSVERVGIGKNAQTSRILDFTHNVRTEGKDRHGLGRIENPTFEQIISTLGGN